MWAATRRVLAAALADGAFPAAVVEVGRATSVLGTVAMGRLTGDAGAPAASVETVFDLASLTKVMATTSLTMQAVAGGRLTLETPVAAWLDGWDTPSRSAITIRHLLDHSSGLPAHDRFWTRTSSREGVAGAIATAPLLGAPGTRSVYSDLGFMALGFVLEAAIRQPLDGQFRELASAARLGEVAYCPPAAWRARTAPTEFDPWRDRWLVGEVHDENAALLAGVAGHAGLFGTAGAVGRFARLVLQTFTEPTRLGTPDLMQTMAARTGVPDSSRALGWDTMRPTSSCGTRLSARAIGHTGFTGTSLWVDPEQDLYVVFLTNRVHPSRANDRLTRVRPRLHDAVVEDLVA